MMAGMIQVGPHARRVRWLVSVVLALHARPACAGDPVREAAILVRALSYERNLPARAGEDVVVAVVHEPADAASAEMGAAVLAAFQQHEGATVQGLALRAVSVPWGAEAPAALDVAGADVVYVCAALDASLPALLALARETKRITMAHDEASVLQGASIAVVEQGGAPRIVVNLPASKEEGSEFGSELLSLAKVIR